MKYDLISADSLISEITDTVDMDYTDVDSLREYIARAIQDISINMSYKPNLCLSTVSNYKASLPKGIKRLDFILFKKNKLVDAVCGCGSNPQTSTVKGCLDVAFSCHYQYLHYNRKSPMVLYNSNFEVCDNTPCNIKSCLDYYTIDFGSQSIITTFEEGTLLIGYRTPFVDEEGNYMFPNTVHHRDFILNYVYYKYWQKRDFQKEEGASQRMMLYYNIQKDAFIRARHEDLKPTKEEIMNIYYNTTNSSSLYEHYKLI